MINRLSSLRPRVTFTTLFLSILSITIVVATPFSMQRNLVAPSNLVDQNPVLSAAQTPSISTSGSWTDITPSPSPPPRLDAAMAFDKSDGYVVLFGGFTAFTGSGLTTLSDTWVYSQGGWTNITATAGPSPPPRYAASMAFDAADHYVVLFGGLSVTGSTVRTYDDTWLFSGGVWTNITATSGTPGPRLGASMAFDAKDNYTVLFGGAGSGGFPRDTWKFKFGAWTSVSTVTSPPGRYLASMTYDAADSYAVLFGGNSTTHSNLSDTWEFSGGSWTNITSSPSPPARDIGAMAFDKADGYVLLFGGQKGSGGGLSGYLDDTWEFSTGLWTNITSPGPGPLGVWPSMAFDPKDGYILLATLGFGGPTGVVEKTWKFSGASSSGFDFTLSSPSPPGLTVAQGGSSSYSTITATLSSGTPAPVTFSPSGVPAGVTPTILNNGCRPTCTVKIGFYATPSATVGTVTITINVAGGGASHSTSLSLTVSPPLVAGVKAGDSATYVPIRVIATSTIPALPIPQFIIDLNATKKIVVTVQTVSLQTNVTVKEVSTYLNNTSKTSILVGDLATGQGNLTTNTFIVVLIPGGLSTGSQVPGVGGINETVQMSYLGTVRTVNILNVTITQLGPGVTGYFREYVVWDQATGVLLEEIFSANASSSTGGTLFADIHLKIVSTNLWSTSSPPPSPDFQITASPTSVTAQGAATGTSTITIAPLNGFDGTVSLASTVSPSGLTCTLSPTSLPAGSGSSSLTCSGSAGTYNVNVTATSGTLSHSVAVSVSITAPAPSPPPPPPATIFGLPPLAFYGIIGAIAAIAVATTAILLTRTRTKPTVPTQGTI